MADINITVHRQRDDFTKVPNSAFDGSLPLSAIGLYAYILHLPADKWKLSIVGLAKCLKCGEYSVRSGFDKLEEAGFLKRTKLRDDKGRFAGYDYDIYDEKQPLPTEKAPNEEPMPEKPEEDSPAIATPCDARPHAETPHAGKPHVDEPQAEAPHVENHTQNKNIYNQDLSNIPPIVPPQETPKKRRRRGEPREAPDWKPERFAGLWEFYPKEGRKNKQGAMDAWDKLKPDDALIRRIGLALKVQKKSEEWQKGIGIPHLSTYLNKQRWTDVTEEELKKRPVIESQKEEVFGWQM